MKDLKEMTEELIKQHGADKIVEAMAEAGAIKKPLGDPPTCPAHTYWNGHACVVDIG